MKLGRASVKIVALGKPTARAGQGSLPRGTPTLQCPVSMLRHIGKSAQVTWAVSTVATLVCSTASRLNLLPDGQAADSHGFRFHGL